MDILTRTNIRVFFFLLIFSLLLRAVYFFAATVWSYEELFYAMGAQKMIAGEVLYRDFIDLKPPGIYLVYMLLVQIAGEAHQPVAIKCATLALQVGTAFVFYRVGTDLGGRRRAFVFAVAWIVAVSLNRTAWLLYVFTLTFLPWGLFVFFLLREKNAFKPLSLAAAGFFLGVAALLSTPFLVFVVAPPLMLWSQRFSRRDIIAKTGFLFLGCGAALLPVALYFIRNNAVFDWYWCNFVWGKYYNGDFSFLTAAKNLLRSLAAVYEWYPLYAIALWGLIVFFRERRRGTSQTFYALAIVAALLLIARLVLQRPVARYTVYLTPLVALGISLVDFSRLRRVWLFLCLVPVAVAAIYTNAGALAFSPDAERSRMAPVKHWLSSRLTPNDKIFVWNNGLFFYHLTGAPMATGFFFPELYLDNTAIAPRMRPHDVDYIWQKFRGQLVREAPRYLIDTTGNWSAAEDNARIAAVAAHMVWFRAYVREHYVLARDFTGLTLRFENTEGSAAPQSLKIWERRSAP